MVREQGQTLRVWDPQSGACLAVLEGHTYKVDGPWKLSTGRLLSWSGDESLRLWDAQTGVCLKTLEGHTDGVRGAIETIQWKACCPGRMRYGTIAR